jgi:putative SOS response-associated peptidase YedK
MCGRYTQTTTHPDVIAQAFDLSEKPHGDFVARYNIAPTQLIATVVQDAQGNKHLHWMSWGLIPAWAKDESIASQLINARSETLSEKPSFREAYRKQRCLVIADGFYEWKTEGKSKTPMYIRMKDKSLFGMAGLWERWKNPTTGEIKTTCTIITTTSNELIAPLHPRMAVILPRDEYNEWLNPALTDTTSLQPMLKAYDGTLMEAYTVSTKVNNVNYDAADLILPVDHLPQSQPQPRLF